MEPGRFLERAIAAAREIDGSRIYGQLARLASGVSLKLDDTARTASISRAGKGRYRIRVSPAFVARHLRTDDDALHLLLHELFHGLRGDFSRVLCQRHWLSHEGLNVALDILVDAHLARLAFSEPPPYLSRLYPWREFPANLLLPPTAMARSAARHDRRWRHFALPHDELFDLVAADRGARARFVDLATSLFREAGAPNPPRIATLYVKGWLDSPSGTAFLADFAEAMTSEFPSLRDLLQALVLLGDHSRKGNPPFVFGEMGGESDEVKEDRIDEVGKRESREFFEAVRLAIVRGCGPPRSRIGAATQPGVIGFPGRREIAFLGCGVFPVFVQTALPGPEEVCEQVHVYLDVSGSTECFHRVLYGLTLGMGDVIGSPVYLFSNVVEAVKLGDLEAGLRLSTGGTDFDCVVSHALDHDFSRILVVTDGFARLEDSLAAKARARGLRIFLVFTSEGPEGPHLRCPLTPLAERWWVLPENLVEKERTRIEIDEIDFPWGLHATIVARVP